MGYRVTWSLYVDDVLKEFAKAPVPQAIWQDSLGRGFSLSAEILNFEDDMVGVAEEPCVFTQMSYLSDGVWQEWVFTGMETPMSDDPAEWWIEPIQNSNEDSLLIYDVKPR